MTITSRFSKSATFDSVSNWPHSYIAGNDLIGMRRAFVRQKGYCSRVR